MEALAKNYINQLGADIRYSVEKLPGTMNDREDWRERESQEILGCLRDLRMMIGWWYIYEYNFTEIFSKSDFVWFGLVW